MFVRCRFSSILNKKELEERLVKHKVYHMINKEVENEIKRKMMSDPAPLQRSPEVEDLTHLTDKDKQNLTRNAEQRKCSLHRSEEMEDLAHLSSQDINKPLINNQNTNIK
jgi:hypothetical protein